MKRMIATGALLGFLALVGCSGGKSTSLKSGGTATNEKPVVTGGAKDKGNTAKAPAPIN
jgi:hypothetical protein